MRIDLEGYRNAMRKGRNVICTKQGGVTRRPGTQWISTGKVAISGANSISSFRKFQYAPGTTFQLEFCDKGIRFYSNGAQVWLLVSTLPDWVSGTSYPAGAFVKIGGIPYYLYNGPLINSTVAPGTDVTHWDDQAASNPLYAIYEVPAPYSGTNFTPPNYWQADVCNVQILGINDVVYIVNPNFPVWKLTRFSNTNWVMQQVNFNVPAMMDENATDETLTANAVSGSITLTANANAAWVTGTLYVPGNTVLQGGLIYDCMITHTSGTFTTDLANGNWVLVTTFQAGHVGSFWQLTYNRPSSYIQALATGSTASYTLPTVALAANNGYQLPLVGTWEVQTYGTWQGVITIGVSYDNGVTWQVITSLTSQGDANYSISGQELQGGIYSFAISGTGGLASSTPPRIVLTADNQFVYGLVQITAVGGPYSATATVIGAPLYSTSPTQYWSEGAWSAVRGYPQALAVFQERIWYGYSTAQPQRVWATQTDDIENFALFDQSQATYGLAFDLNAPGRGPIRWLAAQTDLFAGLSGAEWILSSGNGTSTAITPSAIQALEHTVNGSAPNIPGLIIGQACMYVQRKGRAFQQMLFSVFTDKYMSSEMQVSSQHLTAAGIMQFDYQQQFEEQSLLWAVCGDGSLISMTYAMEQKVFGWTKHTTGTDQNDVVISVSVTEGADGQDDEVWLTILRDPATAKGCQIERIYPVEWQTANVGQVALNEMCYADCASFFTTPAFSTINGLPLCLIGRTLVASIVPASQTGAFSIRNLPCTAAVFPAEGGAVTIPNYKPAAGDVVVVGLPINWMVQPMRLDLDPRMGPTPGLYKSVRKLVLRTLNSIGGQWACYGAPPIIGTLSVVTDIRAYPITENSGLPPPFTANVPLDVPIDVGGLFGYSYDPAFAIQGFDPLPFTLLGIAALNDLGGKP